MAKTKRCSHFHDSLLRGNGDRVSLGIAQMTGNSLRLLYEYCTNTVRVENGDLRTAHQPDSLSQCKIAIPI